MRYLKGSHRMLYEEYGIPYPEWLRLGHEERNARTNGAWFRHASERATAMKIAKSWKSHPETCAAMRCKATEDLLVVPINGEEPAFCPAHVGDAQVLAGNAVDDGPFEGGGVEQPPQDVAREVALAKVEAEEVFEEIKTFEIQTRDDMVFVAEILADVKGKYNRIVEREQEITKPLNEALKSARGLFRPVKEYLAESERHLKKLIEAFKMREMEANQEAIDAAAEAHAQGDDDTAKAELAKVTHLTNVDGVTTYTKWDFEVVDADAVPRNFLLIDEKKIRKHCNHTTEREPIPIPGVRFFPKAVVASRAAQ